MNGYRIGRRDFFRQLGAVAAAAVALPGCADAAAPVPGAAGAPGHVGFPQVIGAVRRHVATADDTLVELAPAHRVGFVELAAANPGVDPWLPGAGTEILLPTEHVLPDGLREGILINLADMRLYWFPGAPGVVESYAIGTGRAAWHTPRGSTTIRRKAYKPSWYVPASIRRERPELPAVVPPGPDNPLGIYAFYLGWTSYLVHDTNEPFSVGRQASHGCVHLYPDDIKQLYPRIPVGTKVSVVYQQAKIGWRGDELLLEVHPSREQSDEIEEKGGFTPAKLPDLTYRLAETAGPRAAEIDWDLVHRAVAERRGVPVPVLKGSSSALRGLRGWFGRL